MVATVLQLHTAWAWVVVVGNGLAGAWALAAHQYPQARRRALWWFVAVMQVTVLPQVLLGVWMLAVQDIVAPDMHVFYGFVSFIAVALIYSYRNQMRHKQYLLYGLGCLFVMGLGIRSMFLG